MTDRADQNTILQPLNKMGEDSYYRFFRQQTQLKNDQLNKKPNMQHKQLCKARDIKTVGQNSQKQWNYRT